MRVSVNRRKTTAIYEIQISHFAALLYSNFKATKLQPNLTDSLYFLSKGLLILNLQVQLSKCATRASAKIYANQRLFTKIKNLSFFNSITSQF